MRDSEALKYHLKFAIVDHCLELRSCSRNSKFGARLLFVFSYNMHGFYIQEPQNYAAISHKLWLAQRVIFTEHRYLSATDMFARLCFRSRSTNRDA